MNKPDTSTTVNNGEQLKFAPNTRLQKIKYDLHNRQDGKIGWIFLWLIGVPVPLLLVFFLLRGCT
jgi:hypothetical protein